MPTTPRPPLAGTLWFTSEQMHDQMRRKTVRPPVPYAVLRQIFGRPKNYVKRRLPLLGERLPRIVCGPPRVPGLILLASGTNLAIFLVVLS